MPEPGPITLSALPKPDQASDIELTVPPAPNAAPLDAAAFRRIIARAVPIPADDPGIRAWHYAPWCEVAFRVAGQPYLARLFLGGRGLLVVPGGNYGYFWFE